MKPSFASRTGDSKPMRALKRATLALVVVWASLALFSGWRAWVQVLALDLTLSEERLGPDTEITVEATSSGRTTVSVSLEFRQGDLQTTLDDVLVIRTSRDPALDPRFKHGRATVGVPARFLAAATPGAATVRAVARGRSQFLRTPPPKTRTLSVPVVPAAISDAPAVVRPAGDLRRVLTVRAREIAAALAARDVAKVATYVHPTLGVRISHTTYVQPDRDLHFSAADLRHAWTSGQEFVWGTADGTGEPIRMTLRGYVELWLKHDFATAPEIGYNAAPLRSGNTPNNLAEVYPASVRVEQHFPGFDPRYEGMDWQSLWLVFQRSGTDWFLTGIARGSWTI